MESQDWRESEDFFKRFLLQGKIISKLITFWWRYSDANDTTDNPKKEAADILEKCFFPGFTDVDALDVDALIAPPPPTLLGLFSAEPRQYLEAVKNGHPRDSYDLYDEDILGQRVKTLITVFKDVIESKENYLSPIFSPTELNKENKSHFSYYEFKIDTSGTKFGRLTDPEIVVGDGNSLLKYIYTIPIPPRHLSPENPKHRDTYDKWIEDKSKPYPPSPHIPFTT